MSVLWYWSRGGKWHNFLGDLDSESLQVLILMLGSLSGAGTAVGAVWVSLLLGGRWKAERSWIDRLGRVIGIGWMALALVYYAGVDWVLFSFH